jgi:hypothetical protein
MILSVLNFKGIVYLIPFLNFTGISSEVQGVAARQSASSPRHLTFNVGDKVKVAMDVEVLKQMQEGHGGWNPRMAEVSLFRRSCCYWSQSTDGGCIDVCLLGN